MTFSVVNLLYRSVKLSQLWRDQLISDTKIPEQTNVETDLFTVNTIVYFYIYLYYLNLYLNGF